jgi:hypothetical protein
LLERIALAVLLKNVDVVGEAIQGSKRAPVRRSDRNKDGHSSNGRFDVTMVEPRS